MNTIYVIRDCDLAFSSLEEALKFVEFCYEDPRFEDLDPSDILCYSLWDSFEDCKRNAGV